MTDPTTNLPTPSHASLFTSFTQFSKNNKNEQPLLVSSMISGGLGLLQARFQQVMQVMQPLCQGRMYKGYVTCWSCTGYHSKDISSNGTKKEGIHYCRNATLGYSRQCKYQCSADAWCNHRLGPLDSAILRRNRMKTGAEEDQLFRSNVGEACRRSWLCSPEEIARLGGFGIVTTALWGSYW